MKYHENIMILNIKVIEGKRNLLKAKEQIFSWTKQPNLDLD